MESVASSVRVQTLRENDEKMFHPDTIYARELAQRATKRLPGVFNNGKPYHASVVMENIFRETRRNPVGGVVRIYGKNLNGEISSFDNYQHELTKFLLTPGTQIQVIVDEEPQEAQSQKRNAFGILQMLSKSEKIGHKIGLRKVAAPSAVSELIGSELEFPGAHFAVSSENMYRLELDPELHYAECSFNDGQTSALLTKIFDAMFSNKGDNYTVPFA